MCIYRRSNSGSFSSMAKLRKPNCYLFVLAVVYLSGSLCVRAGDEYTSAVGDPGMRKDGLRLAIESWNQCNEVGEEVPGMGSPRAADCFDIYKASPQAKGKHSGLFSMFFLVYLCPCNEHLFLF